VHWVRKQNKAMDKHKEIEAIVISEKDKRALLKKIRRHYRRKKK
jgi:hypothetical protein